MCNSVEEIRTYRVIYNSSSKTGVTLTVNKLAVL